MRAVRQSRSWEQGQSMVEMALTLPILILVFLAIFDFGRMFFLYSQVSNSAREGARWGSVTGILGMGDVDQWRDCEGIRAEVRARFPIPVTLQDSDINIAYDDGVNVLPFTCNGSTGSGPNPSQIVPGNRILVTVETEFEFITPLMNEMVPNVPVSFTAARTIISGGTRVPICCY